MTGREPLYDLKEENEDEADEGEEYGKRPLHVDLSRLSESEEC